MTTFRTCAVDAVTGLEWRLFNPDGSIRCIIVGAHSGYMAPWQLGLNEAGVTVLDEVNDTAGWCARNNATEYRLDYLDDENRNKVPYGSDDDGASYAAYRTHETGPTP